MSLPEGSRKDSWLACAAFTSAAILIRYALQISNGHLNGPALVLLTVALVACIAAIAAPPMQIFARRGRSIVYGLACAGLAFQLCAMFQRPPGMYMKLSDPKLYLVYLGGIIVAGVVAALSVLSVRPQIWLPMLTAVHFAMGVWMIHVSPAPKIDVFYMQNAACGALAHARNPT